MDAYIVIGVMILMIVAFVMNKWPFGLITMSCCIILGVTGVLDASGTFAGFCNPFVVMLAGSFVVTNALAKTSFISNVQKMEAIYFPSIQAKRAAYRLRFMKRIFS